MLDDFLIRVLLAGIGVALVAGPFGCFIIWRRQAYFGDTLAHSALLGVALGVFFQINLMLSVFAIAVLISISLIIMQRQKVFSSDSLLGMLSHSSLALGLVALAFMPGSRVDLQAMLFGDILSVSNFDIALIYGGGALLLQLLRALWNPLFAATVDHDLAVAEGVKADRANLVFMILMALVIAISMKLVGVLLITALLIIPAITARRFSSGPEQMAILAAAIGVISVIGGLFASVQWDMPSGPSIVVVSFLLFLVVSFLAALFRFRRLV